MREPDRDPYPEIGLAEAYKTRVAKMLEDLTLRKWAVEQAHGDVEKAAAIYQFILMPVTSFLQN